MTSEKETLLARKIRGSNADPDPPDGGWGWAVVFGGFLFHTISGGIFASYGVLYVPIMDIFGIDKADVSWIGALRLGIFLGSAPLVIPFTKFVSCRLLTIAGGIIAFASLLTSALSTSFLSLLVCLGILQGIACSFAYVSSILTVNYYFDKKRAAAIGLVIFGTGVGQTFYPPLQEFLLREYGLSGALLINSAIMLNFMVCGVLYFPLQNQKLQENDGDTLTGNKIVWRNLRAAFDLSVFKIPIFGMFFINNVLSSAGYSIIIAFLPDRAVNQGFTLSNASVFMSIIGIFNGIGRISIGILATKMYNFRPTFYVILIFISGVAECFLPLCRRHTDFIFVSIGFGLAAGGYTCLCNVLLLDLFTRDLLASSLGFVTLGQGIGGFIGSPAAGISEGVGSDDVMFYFGGSMFLLAAVLLKLSFLCGSRDKGKTKTISYTHG